MNLSNKAELGSVGLPIGDIRQKVWDHFGEKHFFMQHEDELVRVYEYFVVTFASVYHEGKTLDTILHDVNMLMKHASERCSCMDGLRSYFRRFNMKFAQVQQEEIANIMTQVGTQSLRYAFFDVESFYIPQ